MLSENANYNIYINVYLTQCDIIQDHHTLSNGSAIWHGCWQSHTNYMSTI